MPRVWIQGLKGDFQKKAKYRMRLLASTFRRMEASECSCLASELCPGLCSEAPALSCRWLLPSSAHLCAVLYNDSCPWTRARW